MIRPGMPRRKKATLSPTLLLLGLFCVSIFRVLTMFPSNDDLLSSSSSSLVRHIEQNPPERLLGGGRNVKLIFVHVGKAAGETIQWRIKLSCKLRKSKILREECVRQFHGEESSLSKATIGYLHCDKLRPPESITNATTFLFSIRNPVDRIVSWYQYMHPDNCFADRPSAACNLKKDNNPWGITFYRTCFPDVNDFVRSMGENVILMHGINCSAFALETVQGEGPAGMLSECRGVERRSHSLCLSPLTKGLINMALKGPSNHMHYNYFYYANRTITQFPERNILAIRQEALWDDLRSVEWYLGGDPRRPFETQGPTITHGSEHYRYRAYLDPSLVSRLCCVIPQEIKTYMYLLEQAANLAEREKARSLKALFEGCRAASFADLASSCGWNPL